MNIKSSFIRKRGNNYNVIVEYIDEEGKSKQKSQGKYKNKKDAEKHLIDLKSSINNNKFVVTKDITLVDRCYLYLEHNKKELSPTTISTRLTYIKKNIYPYFKDTKLDEITPSFLQGYLSYLSDNHTSESLKVRYSFVRAVIRESYRLREISENPCDFVKMIKKKDEFIAEVFTRDEVRKIIENLEKEIFEIPILLMLTLGLRLGEACGLRWEDIDFEKNTITINQILIYIHGKGIMFKEPKTTGSKRTLSVPIELMLKLKEWKVKYDLYSNIAKLEYPGIVCLNSTYLPYIPSTLRKAWYKFLDNNNIKKVRLHDLRHTNATMMLLAGTDMKTVSERLGHTDIKISMNRYSHVLEEMDKKASENISNIMFK